MTSTAPLTQDWNARAAAAVQAATPESLDTFLTSAADSPSRAHDFYHLLIVTATTQQQGVQLNEAWEGILGLLATTAGLPEALAQPPPDFGALVQQRSRAGQNSRTVVQEVFDLSLKDTSQWGADVANRLWLNSRCQNHLLTRGALQMCAQHGRQLLLDTVFDKIAVACGENVSLLKQVICRPDDQEKRTALGWSIVNGHEPCMKSLEVCMRRYSTINGSVGDCLYSYSNACDDLEPSILHFVIDVAGENLTKYRTMRAGSGERQEHLRILQSSKKIVKAITTSWPESLLPATLRAPRSGEPEILQTVYARAKHLDVEIIKHLSSHDQKELCFEKLIYDSVFEHLTIPHLIQKALYAGEGKVFELDLSDFNHPLNDFEGFVKELEGYKEEWVFEKTLLYLTLPDLGCVNSTYSQILPEAYQASSTLTTSMSGTGLIRPTGSPASRTISRFLDWLYVKKEVRTIFEVKIPDDHAWPLSEFFVFQNLLRRYSVRKLHWRKLDIDLQALMAIRHPHSTAMNGTTGKATSDSPVTTHKLLADLREIHLYSSGNWGVLYHWASPHGLKSLEKLERVYITMVEPPHLEFEMASTSEPVTTFKPPYLEHDESEVTSTSEPITMYQQRLKHLKEDFVHLLFEVTGATIDRLKTSRCTWATFTALSFNQISARAEMHRLREDIMPCIDFLGYLKQQPIDSPWPGFCALVRTFRERPVRIAIIDNGIDRFRSTICPNIEDGVSFATFSRSAVDGNKVLPWWSASDPHGTQMAYLIRSVNPHCKLFPARVGTTRDDIDPALAVKAIEWAIAKHVDIISISWTTRVESKALLSAIAQAAKTEKILIFCSTADEGVHGMDKIWPADCPEVIKVSASDRLGHPRPQSQRLVDVLVDGDRLSAHGPSYMKNLAESSISGSSVATALAAGVASLCLAMVRLANDQKTADLYKERGQMLNLFRMMHPQSADGKDKLLIPAKLFKEGFSIDEGNPRVPRAVSTFDHEALRRIINLLPVA